MKIVKIKKIPRDENKLCALTTFPRGGYDRAIAKSENRGLILHDNLPKVRELTTLRNVDN